MGEKQTIFRTSRSRRSIKLPWLEGLKYKFCIVSNFQSVDEFLIFNDCLVMILIGKFGLLLKEYRNIILFLNEIQDVAENDVQENSTKDLVKEKFVVKHLNQTIKEPITYPKIHTEETPTKKIKLNQ